MPLVVALSDFTAAAPDVVPSLGRTIVALAAVLALIGGLAWLMKKGVLRQKSAGAIRLESALPLGDRRSLAIVTVEGRRLLVGLAPSQVTLVTELAPAQTFDQALQTATAIPGERR